MSINTRDTAAGGLLLMFALLGLWLNQEHGLGSARRMGPGYMPMLVFVVQAGLGAVILGIGLFSGPGRLEPWPGRELAVILASLCVFALLLERGGLLLAVAATVVVSAFADRTQRPLSVLGLVLFLMALCWWVFVRQLDLRVAVWPLGWTP